MKPVAQEPVAYIDEYDVAILQRDGHMAAVLQTQPTIGDVPLYLAPPSLQAPLTNEQIINLARPFFASSDTRVTALLLMFARALFEARNAR